MGPTAPTRGDQSQTSVISRRRLLLGLGGAALAGRAGAGPARAEFAPGPTDATPLVPSAVHYPPRFVPRDPIPLGDGRFRFNGTIITLDPEIADRFAGLRIAPIEIDGETYYFDPAVAAKTAPPAPPPAAPPAPPALAEGPPPQESAQRPCGGDDSQDVELYEEFYNGKMGVSREIVARNQAAVAVIRWNGDLRQRFAIPGSVNARYWCSGTLIADDLFLTAGHCFDQYPGEHEVPRRNDDGLPLSRAEIVRHMHVEFNYQLGSNGLDRSPESYAITDLVEDQGGNLDYAIVRLRGRPGRKFGIVSIGADDAPEGSMICIMGHPAGQPKKVGAGPATRYENERILYEDIDTEGGSSGSCILGSPEGPLVGVHTHGGCDDPKIRHNHGVRISRLLQASPKLRELAAAGGSLMEDQP